MWNTSLLLCFRVVVRFSDVSHDHLEPVQCLEHFDHRALIILWMSTYYSIRDTMDSVKQSAALCLLRLNRTSADLVPMGEWTARVVHLLNDQHLVRLNPCAAAVLHTDSEQVQVCRVFTLEKCWQSKHAKYSWFFFFCVCVLLIHTLLPQCSAQNYLWVENKTHFHVSV